MGRHILDVDTVGQQAAVEAPLHVLLAVPVREAPLVRSQHLGLGTEVEWWLEPPLVRAEHLGLGGVGDRG